MFFEEKESVKQEDMKENYYSSFNTSLKLQQNLKSLLDEKEFEEETTSNNSSNSSKGKGKYFS